MSATAGIYFETWTDQSFSQVVRVLLENGLCWVARDLEDNQMCSFEYYDDPMDMGNWDSCPISEQEVLFADLDERSRNGTTVVALLLLGEDDDFTNVDLRKIGSCKFDIYISVTPRIGDTWLTDFSSFATRLVAPLVQNGINIREVRYENGY